MSVPDPHLEDGELVRLLHEEHPDPTAAGDHLACCDRCSRRLASLERRESALLEILDATAPRLREPRYDPEFLARLATASGSAATDSVRAPLFRRPGVLRWAAVLALLAVGLSVAPVRAWVADAASALWTVVAGGAPAPAPPPPGTEGDATEVRARLEGTVLRIELGAGTRIGAVTFTREEGATAVARLTGGGADSEILAAGDGFRIVAAERGASLRVGIPATAREVVVSVGGVVRSRMDPADRSDSTWTVSLDPR